MPKVRDYLNQINDRMFLPGLQREFVWEEQQIEHLFDSLIRKYPIGILIRWDVRSRNSDEYYCYRFIKDYISDEGRVPNAIEERFDRYNELVDDDDPTATFDDLVIDGQQRLNSLYIGVTGSIARYKGGRGYSRTDVHNWEQRRLCIDLFGHPEYGDVGRGDYQFQFRRVDDDAEADQTGYSQRGGTQQFWFPLPDSVDEEGNIKTKRDIRELALERVNDEEFVASGEDREQFRFVTTAVIDAFHDEVLAFDIPDETVDRSNEEIKDIFQRLNVQGSTPKPYQLLMSKMMSNWPYQGEASFNPREQVEAWLDEFKEAYPAFDTSIDRDLFMRYTCFIANKSLTVSDVNTFNQADMDELRQAWSDSPEGHPNPGFDRFAWFRKGLEKSLTVMTKIGLDSSAFPSMIPAALLGKFFYENPDADVDENVNAIARFFALALLLQSSHGVLNRTKMRQMAHSIAEQAGDLTVFPTDALFDELGLHPSREDIRRTVEYARYSGEPGQPLFANTSVAPILALLDEAYTSRSSRDASDYHVDHIYPRSKQEQIETAVGDSIDINRLGNLQLLPASVNVEEKQAMLPADWFASLSPGERDEIKRINQFPESSLDPANYDGFVSRREAQIVDHLADKYVK